MSLKTDPFSSNRLYELLTNQSIYSKEILQEVNAVLHEQPELAGRSHSIEGSYFHIVCRNSSEQENVAYRMVYALSNAGADPNITDGNGNTPLHEALIRDFNDVGLDLIQALFRIGVDQRIVNKQGKTADTYLDDNLQLIALYEGYGEGIWSAIETSNIPETERLIKGLIKIDCKHNSSQTLLDTARDIDCLPIIRILADYQVTIEFVHSILACDWERLSLIHRYEGRFIKMNLADSIHTLTWLRATNRTYSKTLLEFSLESESSELFELIFNSPILKSKIDVNTICTDGLPFYFHLFNKYLSIDIRREILVNADLQIKSSKGETILFHLVHLYDQNDDEKYLQTFTEIITKQPLLLTQRNEQGRTILDEIELTSAVTYKKLRVFWETIKDILWNQLKDNIDLERYVLNGYGYHFLLLFNNENVQMTKALSDSMHSLRFQHGLATLMGDLIAAIAHDDLEKIRNILKTKPNICFAKDWAGRTCTHLAVLYRRRRILNYICESYPKVVNLKDNLNRTSLHYACIMNDKPTIDILQQVNAKKTLDCLNLYPDDYKSDRDLCCEEFHARDFPTNELEKRLSGISDYLKLSFYFSLKTSIEENLVENINAINEEVNAMGFSLEYFSPDSYVNDWIKGERYIPSLFLALEHRAVAAFQCLMELGLPPTGRMYISKSTDNSSRCVSVRTRAEELESFDIIGMINDLEDDSELKQIFKRHLSSSSTIQRQSMIGPRPQTTRPTLSQQGTILHHNDKLKSQACILL